MTEQKSAIAFGSVADDFTGASDLALMLASDGMATVLAIGVPEGGAPEGTEALVVALKSRTIDPGEACAHSVTAAMALKSMGARQILFKVCSTFDSTAKGNIGPVTDALASLLGAKQIPVCPAFPAAGRSVYLGHLFVNEILLSDSPMRDHPLTPMRDSSLVRLMAAQSKLPVGLAPYKTVAAGPEALAARMRSLEGAVIVDALEDDHLRCIADASLDLPLMVGGSGIALGIPAAYRRQGWIKAQAEVAPMRAAPGRAVVLAGSCSAATLGQVAQAEAGGLPVLRISPDGLASGAESAEAILAWIDAQPADRPVVVASTADPEAVRGAQARLGLERAAELVEAALAAVAKALPARGVTKLLVAGGETSGAVVSALGVKLLQVGPAIAPGVPWLTALDRPNLCLALKSGNFGAPDMFLTAWSKLA
ncbi:MAG: 3-oxo-tetronate kinase [Elsteraceae bacterium]